tara:strand:- start:164 stop:367 length:204 start_codon:yes stop_codon:yes gene_type:complete
MIEVKLVKGESVDRALKRLKKKIDREGVLQQIRDRQFYVKPSDKRQKQKKKAKFEAMLQARRNKLER